MKRIGVMVIVLVLCLWGTGLRKAEKYNVIVIGGDPEGIAAAVSSAREGQKVLLIDSRPYVGGLYTSGMLSMLDLNYLRSGEMAIVNQGFFKEFYDSVGEEANIDIKRTKEYFSRLLRHEGIDVLLNAKSINPLKQGKKVVGVEYIIDKKSYRTEGKVIIDASRDAAFARKAGVHYKVGREDMGLGRVCAAATLVFSVKDVDWEFVRNYVSQDDSVHTGATHKVAWGYPEMLEYVPSSAEFQMRKLNLSLQDDGSVVINAFQIFNVNPLSSKSINESYEHAVKELPRIVQFLRENAVGFEKASLAKYADELYIREGVKIQGEYTLTAEDVFTNKNFKDKIAYASYPTDLQATKKDGVGGTILTSRNLYTIPLSIIVPQNVQGLLVVGRSASYDSIAHSSARTVPVGMAVGEAAGVLASYSQIRNLSLKEASRTDEHIGNIQQILRREGVTLDTPINENHGEDTSWAYKHIVSLRGRGFLSKEYHNENDYRCEKPANGETVGRIFKLIKANSNWILPPLTDEILNKDYLGEKEILELANNLLNENYQSLKELYEYGFITEETFNRTECKQYLLNEDIYALIDEFLVNEKVLKNFKK